MLTAQRHARVDVGCMRPDSTTTEHAVAMHLIWYAASFAVRAQYAVCAHVAHAFS